MTPTVDERLASVVRALSEVILPSLPPEAALAQEQVQLCIGHLQILRGQLDAIPQYEADELADAIALGNALADCQGGAETQAASSALKEAIADGRTADDPAGIRRARVAINSAVAVLVGAVGADGEPDGRRTLSRAILEHESVRALKDRRWLAPFGFDEVPAGE